jgi:hypothetical protein
MALRVAVANGNWSNPAIWNDGVLPRTGDVVASNGFTVTIDQNINVDLLTNTVRSAVPAVPNMTSDTTPSGIVTASAQYDSGTYASWRAFDGNGGFPWLTLNTAFGWVAYEFTSTKIISRYILTPPSGLSSGSIPRDWTFEGWNGTGWVILDTVTGNSGSSNVTRSFVNTVAFIKYRINITANNGHSYVGVGELALYEANDYGANSVAGGTFNMGGGVNVTCTGSIPGGATTVLTWNGGAGTTSSITAANIFGASVASVNNVVLNGTGTLNINARITGFTSNVGSRTITVTNNGVINLVGNIEGGPPTLAIVVLISSNCTFNITGTITNSGANSLSMLTIGAICTVNITGNVINNVTQASNNTININAAATVFITGSVRTITTVNTAYAISTGQAGFLSIVGSIEAGIASPTLLSTSGSAINLLSGPFVCSSYGFFPYQVIRMHLIPTATSYFEFRDETTNGAISPGSIAPSTRLLSPSIVADNPIPANVRFGTVYSLGTQTGTLHMPHPNQVSYGIPVDNTFGNAVLSMSDIWNVQSSTLTTNGSIGQRLKNASTVESTGDQLSAFS